MSADDLEHRMAEAERECGNSEWVSCYLVQGHEGPCWSPRWDYWGGLSQRCMDGGCIRASGHKGMHEGPDGATFSERTAKARRERERAARAAEREARQR